MHDLKLLKAVELMYELNGMVNKYSYTPPECGGCTSWGGWAEMTGALALKGFSLLGSGHFAAAFEHQDLPGFVIKVGFRKDDSGAAYAAFCRANAGMVGLPVIHLVKRFTRCYMVVMDKFQSMGIYKDWCRMPETYEQQVIDASFRVVGEIIDYGEVHTKVLNQYLFDGNTKCGTFKLKDLKHIIRLARTAVKIREFFYGLASFDMHRGNAMIDLNHNLVITDPVSWTSDEGLKESFDRIACAE